MSVSYAYDSRSRGPCSPESNTVIMILSETKSHELELISPMTNSYKLDSYSTEISYTDDTVLLQCVSRKSKVKADFKLKPKVIIS